MKITKCLEDSGLLIKGVSSETMQMNQNIQADFLVCY